jgi:hypothetical protein
LTSSVRSWVDETGGFELSIITKVNLVGESAFVGLPLMIPVAASSASPSDKDGVTIHVIGGVPPAYSMVVE